MKINFSQKLLSPEGKVVCEMTSNEDGTRGPDRDFTLRAISAAALNGVFHDEKNVGAAEKDLRFALQLKIYRDDVVDMNSDEIIKIRKLIAKMNHTPWIIGQARRMLDGKDTGIVPYVEPKEELEVEEPVEQPIEEESTSSPSEETDEAAVKEE